MLKKIITGLALCMVCVSSFATSTLFEDKSSINAVLTAPLSSIFKQRKNDVRLYFDGRLVYDIEGAEPVQVPLKVRTRGNFRRMNCYNPPLILNFKKKENEGNLLAGQDKLKLVAPCKRSDPYRKLIALEYIAYQLWEMLSEYHFKTRLLDLGYVDSDKETEPWKAQAFVIEDIADAAGRVDMKEKTIKQGDREKLDHAQTALLELFQLLLGNTDYSTLRGPGESDCCHNVRLIGKKGEGSTLYPVPYDFDASGFVNARYAAPANQFPIKKTTQRYFSGWCKEERFYRGAIDIFKTRKDDIYTKISDSGMLDKKTLQNKIRFVDRFYDIIEDEDKVKSKILERCRGDLIPAPTV